MNDKACISFLQWALPHLNLRWPGFRRVRGQVCKRLARRLVELRLSDVEGYRLYLQDTPSEWHVLDAMCRITISRFFRDRRVYGQLPARVFPALIDMAQQQGEKTLSCWCIGTASGEEPYGISLLWDLVDLEKKGVDLSILATEVAGAMLSRARKGCYPASSIRELPDAAKIRAFSLNDGQFCLKPRFKRRVQFRQQDIRNEQPDGAFHLILCRNLVFTYFCRELQEEIGRKILQRLQPGGALVTGIHEILPVSLEGLEPWPSVRSVYRKNPQI